MIPTAEFTYLLHFDLAEGNSSTLMTVEERGSSGRRVQKPPLCLRHGGYQIPQFGSVLLDPSVLVARLDLVK